MEIIENKKVNKKVMDSFNSIWDEWLKRDDLESIMENHFKYRKVFLPFMEEYLDKLPNNAKVLEIGAGTGLDSLYFSKKYPHISFIGSDLSKGSVDLGKVFAKKMNTKMKFVQDDSTKSKFKNEQFDLVFSQGLIEHFPDPKAIMSEQTRITKKGGYVVIDLPQKYNPYTIYKKRSIQRGDWPYGWETAYSVWGLSKLGEKYGLLPLKSVGFNYGKGRDYYFFLVGEAGDLLGKRVPILKPLGDSYSKLIRFIEKKWGVYFLQNIAVSFKRIK